MRAKCTIIVEVLDDGRVAAFISDTATRWAAPERFIRIAPFKWVAGYGSRLHPEYARICEYLYGGGKNEE